MNFSRSGWIGRLLRRGSVVAVLGWLILAALIVAGRAVGQVAFASRPLLAFVSYYESIYLTDVLGGVTVRWWDIDVRSLAVSLDGRWLAYYAFRSALPEGDLYVISLPDGELRRLNEDDAPLDVTENPRWSPDSQSIAYPQGDAMVLVNVTTGVTHSLVSGLSHLSQPTWSPDGSHVAYLATHADRAGIYMTDVQTGQTRRLPVDRAATSFPPAWSPDGRWLAYSSSRVSNSALYRNIYMVDVQTGQIEQLTHDRATVSRPAWSLDGRQIAYISSQEGGHADIQITDVQTGQARRLPADDPTRGSPLVWSRLAWSPDGSWITYGCGLQYLLTAICLMDVSTGEYRILTPGGGNVGSPTWLP